MGAAYFYQLTDQPLDNTLPMLVGKARQAGWRVLVRGVSDAMLERMDNLLWLGPEDGFLPHGRAGGAFDAEQPVLLAGAEVPSRGFDCLISIEGAGLESSEVLACARACVIFDGNDPASLNRARSQWRDLTRAGCAAQYWAQEAGRWTKKAESGN